LALNLYSIVCDEKKTIRRRKRKRGSETKKTPDPYFCLLLTALFLVLYGRILGWGWGVDGEPAISGKARLNPGLLPPSSRAGLGSFGAQPVSYERL